MGKLPLAGTAEGEFCLAGRLKIDKYGKMFPWETDVPQLFQLKQGKDTTLEP
jgi:hypothetical protein